MEYLKLKRGENSKYELIISFFE